MTQLQVASFSSYLNPYRGEVSVPAAQKSTSPRYS